jgi:oligopeptide transport system substrate-binding protein
MSLDKTKLTSLLTGAQKPAGSFVPPPLLSFSRTMGIPYNPSQAKIELRKSGIDRGTRPVSIDFLLPNWDKSEVVGQFVKEELHKNLGIEVVLKPVDHQRYWTQLDLGNFPIFYGTWTADYPDPDNFLSIFLSGSGNSRTGWKNAEFDQSVAMARQFKSPMEREKVYQRLQKSLIEENIVIIPLYYEPNLALVRSRVRNFELNPMDHLYLRNVSVIP